jgi:hypothetical protein
MKLEQRQDGSTKLFGYCWDTYTFPEVGDEEILAQPCVVAAIAKARAEGEALLTRYISHVLAWEGVTFLPYPGEENNTGYLSSEDCERLRALVKARS